MPLDLAYPRRGDGLAPEPYVYNANVLRVVDGDTVDVVADLGFHTWMKMRLRLRGIDAPELHAIKDGKPDLETRLRAVASREALTAKVVTPVRIKSTKADDFGRYLADIFVGDRYINAEMIAEGHAVAYKGVPPP